MRISLRNDKYCSLTWSSMYSVSGTAGFIVLNHNLKDFG